MNVQLDPNLKKRLVESAESIADKIRGRKDQASQLRNMIQVCQTESELPVIENFIRYQAARRETGEFWRGIYIDVIGELRKIAQEDAPNDTELRRTAMQTFFGYLMRSYVYKKSGLGEQRNGPNLPGRTGR